MVYKKNKRYERRRLEMSAYKLLSYTGESTLR